MDAQYEVLIVCGGHFTFHFSLADILDEHGPQLFMSAICQGSFQEACQSDTIIALYQRRRMHKDIAAGPTLTYYGSLFSIAVLLKIYPRFNKYLFNLESHIVFIDISQGKTESRQ